MDFRLSLMCFTYDIDFLFYSNSQQHHNMCTFVVAHEVAQNRNDDHDQVDRTTHREMICSGANVFPPYQID